MPYQIEFSPASDAELSSLRVFDQRQIVAEVFTQLRDQPQVATRKRKCLGNSIVADFEYNPPLWELKVGDFRVYYDVDEADMIVYVHAVRQKLPPQTTAEVLGEKNDH